LGIDFLKVIVYTVIMDARFDSRFRGILERVRDRVNSMYRVGTTEAVFEAASSYRSTRDFYGAISGEGMSLIAEVKKKSPSKGYIRRGAIPEEIAKVYQDSGAVAISVLTNPDFDGNTADMLRVSVGVSIPVLMKEFVVDYCQIAEGRTCGADAVLLIVAILDGEQLPEYIDATRQFGMDPLVEVHDEEDLERALGAGVDIIGINNRDLRTFETDIDTTRRLVRKIPQGYTVVTESGILSREDVLYVSDPRVNAMLVGERLMSLDLNPTLDDIGRTVRMLKG
jgi:indole-3-glycerol phosphate synthase